jgi:glyoxylase-like metal-dependent hydrolase (beta-lactamase superfamily II)
MIARALGAVAVLLAAASCATPVHERADLELWRLDCGKFEVANIAGRPRTLSNGCYLIRHGADYMIWDAGLEERLIGNPDVSPEQTISLDAALVPQLARIGVRPEQIGRVGVSHSHGDHFGQAARFPSATLMIGREDWATMKASAEDAALVRPWIEGKAPVQEIEGDTDVYGDGHVVIVDTPGHTAGHSSLLAHLASGAVLLTGDAVHFRGQLATGRPSGNHVDKIAGARSIQRMLRIEREVPAKIIVQHDPLDIDDLPAFPESAR